MWFLPCTDPPAVNGRARVGPCTVATRFFQRLRVAGWIEPAPADRRVEGPHLGPAPARRLPEPGSPQQHHRERRIQNELRRGAQARGPCRVREYSIRSRLPSVLTLPTDVCVVGVPRCCCGATAGGMRSISTPRMAHQEGRAGGVHPSRCRGGGISPAPAPARRSYRPPGLPRRASPRPAGFVAGRRRRRPPWSRRPFPPSPRTAETDRPR